MNNVSSYFSFRLEFENYKEIEECGPSIFIIEPHGVLPITMFWGGLPILKKQKVTPPSYCYYIIVS